jgi:hypothetical protein
MSSEKSRLTVEGKVIVAQFEAVRGQGLGEMCIFKYLNVIDVPSSRPYLLHSRLQESPPNSVVPAISKIFPRVPWRILVDREKQVLSLVFLWQLFSATGMGPAFSLGARSTGLRDDNEVFLRVFTFPSNP